MNKRINYFLSIIFLLIFTSNTLAKCDFGLNLGDKIPDSFVERSGNLLEDERVHLVYFEADELCGNPTQRYWCRVCIFRWRIRCNQNVC